MKQHVTIDDSEQVAKQINQPHPKCETDDRRKIISRDSVIGRRFGQYRPALPGENADDRYQARDAIANNDALCSRSPTPNQDERNHGERNALTKMHRRNDAELTQRREQRFQEMM